MGIFDIFKQITSSDAVVDGTAPVTPSPQTSTDGQPATLEEQPGSFTKKILVVDDEEYLRDIYKELFEHDGYTVVTAKDGQEGLQKTFEFLPDCILLDINMPIMDGKAMFNQVKSDPRTADIPIIFLTNSGNTNNLMFARDYGANGFLIKSNIDPDEVVKKVQATLIQLEMERRKKKDKNKELEKLFTSK
jgi:two-component system, cell cycle response regulator DivK